MPGRRCDPWERDGSAPSSAGGSWHRGGWEGAALGAHCCLLSHFRLFLSVSWRVQERAFCSGNAQLCCPGSHGQNQAGKDGEEGYGASGGYQSCGELSSSFSVILGLQGPQPWCLPGAAGCLQQGDVRWVGYTRVGPAAGSWSSSQPMLLPAGTGVAVGTGKVPNGKEERNGEIQTAGSVLCPSLLRMPSPLLQLVPTGGRSEAAN